MKISQSLFLTPQASTKLKTRAKFTQALYCAFLFACVLIAPSTFAQETQQKRIYLGIDVLRAIDFRPIQGKRVGLLTHPAGVDRDGNSTIDVLRATDKTQLVALFGPEHGIYGDEKANIPVLDKIDARTGLPVYSLYGKYRKPTPGMLEGLDALVIDLQDLGVRSYTYVSCMKKAIEACFENGVQVVVLDRPNPLGGLKVDGPPMDEEFMSYVGSYRVPYVHGLTIGELALMSKNTPGWLDVTEAERKRGKITIIPMKGWLRSIRWSETGLKWVPTSPAIPTLSAAIGYSMTGLGAQLGGFQHGYGTKYPFRLLTFPNKKSEKIAYTLTNHNIPGLAFKPIIFKDPRKGMTEGVLVLIENWELLRPTEISFHMMRLAAQWNGEQNPFREATPQDQLLFNKHVGSHDWWTEISSYGAKAKVEVFVKEWENRAKIFQKQSKAYWLYQ